MLLRTHILFAIVVGIILTLTLNFSPLNKLIFLAILIISAWLPDIDETRSKTGRKTRPVSDVVHLLFDHRGLFHSLTIIILIALGLLIFKTPGFIVLAFSIGYFSHIFLDMFTRSGIPIFWPLNLRPKGFVTTGGVKEFFFFIILLVLFVFLLVKNFTTLKDIILVAIQSIF